MDNVNVSQSDLGETTDSEDDTVDVADDKLCKKGELESFSDIDDAEVGSYLNNEKEKHFKKIIWEMMNEKYLQEREKRVVAAANVKNSKREPRQKTATGVKKAQSTANTAHSTSPKKRPNSRINYNALSKVLDESLPDSPKRRRSEPDSNKDVGESSAETLVNDDAANETEDEDYGWEDDPNYSHNNNQEYDYLDDDEFF